MVTDSQPSPPDDLHAREIIRNALQGDKEAFEEVIAMYSRRLYAVAYGVLRNPADAEDVVQETFLRAYARRWLIRDPDKFPAWLCRTAWNRACDQVRKHANAPILVEGGILESVADEGTSRPGAGLCAAEVSEALHRLLSRLPENHRVAITLRFMEGMDYREIEKTMGVSNGALRGILARAMKTLREGIDTTLLTGAAGVSQ